MSQKLSVIVDIITGLRYCLFMSYADKIKKALPPEMRRLFSRLGTPSKVQDHLDTLSINFELSGESNFPPIDVFKKKTAHCFEGAVYAASILAFHGHRPLLMDFATAYDDEDHTIALFSAGGGSTSGGKKLWGAISKTNHAVLKFRDAIYRTPRELAMSYFHEYYLWDGRKSLRAYSIPFDLSKYPPEKWITSGESPKDSKLPTGQALDWVMARLAKSHYFPVVPEKMERHLRRASDVELRALKIVGEKDPRPRDIAKDRDSRSGRKRA